MSRKILPSFTSIVSSRRESFSLPDYYRATRYEKYGPYYRESAPQDLMTTIDYRGRESPDSSSRYFLPDIFEDDEIELESKSEHRDSDVKSADDDHMRHAEAVQCQHENEKKSKWVGCVWHFLSLFLRKCRGRKVHAVKNVSNVHFDLNN